MPLLVRLDQERGQADNSGNLRFGGTQYDEVRVAVLCEKFWNSLPARVKAKVLRSADAWSVPAASAWLASWNHWPPPRKKEIGCGGKYGARRAFGVRAVS